MQLSANKLAIMRGSSQYVNPRHYNVQEIGLGKALAQFGWRVTVYSSGPKEEIIPVREGLVWHELPRIGGRQAGWPKHGYGSLLREGADIIQCQDLSNLGVLAAHYAAKRSRVPLVLSLGEYESSRRLKTWLTQGNAGLIRSQVQGVLCKTKAAMHYAEGLRLQPAHYAPVGIDPDAYETAITAETSEQLAAIRTAQAEGYTVLMHIGRMDKEDNLAFLLEVMLRLKSKVKLVLAGEPKAFVEALPMYGQVQEHIWALGRVPNSQIGHLLQASNVYMACSSYEIFGMAAAESIYHGCPVMGYAAGGIAEIIRHDESGWLLSERDVDVWAGRLDTFIGSGQLQAWRAGCLQQGESLLWNERAKTYHHVYEALLARQRIAAGGGAG
ncbi:glycosyltransferase family 4 protein [Paenibacillus sp. MMS18-CY102]|uniref:glycosyltransferase family 4 protein n=1 Tax=Paenibacillus sp. MMS18-CY102 TaxID=2682849 RepID=UPI00136542CA|nr:glycosyltransferase family 4 protein [Paenibacillus sp. MMS18-CY102]MWC27317.1 glycosyltransferase [Paenibacillus sp. MMS18-CY102]